MLIQISAMELPGWIVPPQTRSAIAAGTDHSVASEIHADEIGVKPRSPHLKLRPRKYATASPRA
jgi:hypothetical protein